MKCLPIRFLAAVAFACTLVPGVAQTVDPSRFGEGIRPFSLPNPFARDGSADQGLQDENDFAPESPGDDDIGQQLILKDSERERWLSAQLDTFTFWSDNPANLSTGEEDDVFWGSQLNVGAGWENGSMAMRSSASRCIVMMTTACSTMNTCRRASD
jgi:hypothetical protein